MVISLHYLSCIDDNCEVDTCVSRRDYESRIKSLTEQCEKLAEALEDHVYCEEPTINGVKILQEYNEWKKK